MEYDDLLKQLIEQIKITFFGMDVFNEEVVDIYSVLTDSDGIKYKVSLRIKTELYKEEQS